MTDYHLVMLPAKDDGSVDWESGVGAGPYKIEQNEFGIGTSLVRHDGWHREGAWFDRIDMTVLKRSECASDSTCNRRRRRDLLG